MTGTTRAWLVFMPYSHVFLYILLYIYIYSDGHLLRTSFGKKNTRWFTGGSSSKWTLRTTNDVLSAPLDVLRDPLRICKNNIAAHRHDLF